MKKTIALFLSLVFCFFAASCSLFPSKPEETSGDSSGDTSTPLVPDPVTTPPVSGEDPVTTPPVTDPPATDPPVTDPVPVHEPGRELGKGVLLSDSGLKMNILLDWRAVNGAEAGTADISVTVYLECYSVFVGTRDDGEVSVGEEKIQYSTPVLEIGGPQFNEINFGTYTFTVQKSQGATTVLPLSGKWHFHGEYSGLPLDWVVAQGEITFVN